MSHADDAIREALSKEDADLLAKLQEEPGSFRQIVGIFQGPLNWIYVTFLVAAVVLGIVGVYSVWRFAAATELRPLFYWGGAVAFCLIVLSVVRLVFFMQLNTNRILRELKRLELQVALLAARKNA